MLEIDAGLVLFVGVLVFPAIAATLAMTGIYFVFSEWEPKSSKKFVQVIGGISIVVGTGLFVTAVLAVRWLNGG